MNKTWCVYRLTSPSGKVYIGITNNINVRWQGKGRRYRGSTRIHNAIKKYGWDNFKRDILYSDLSKDEASQLEQNLIAEYQSTNETFGYNLQGGGLSFSTNDETKAKIRAALLNHEVSDDTRQKLREQRSIPVVCIENATVYSSCAEAARELNLCKTSIGKVTNGRQETCGNLHFAKLCDWERNVLPRFHHKEAWYPMVKCLSTGKVYKNISEASRQTGLSRRAISYACNGVHLKCGGMLWEFI